MDQYASPFHHLKSAISSLDQAHHGLATTIGLLSHSGLDPIQQMPEMCHLLQRLFKLTSCGFFWCDSHGNLQDAWCLSPDFLSFKTLMSCAEYQAAVSQYPVDIKNNQFNISGPGSDIFNLIHITRARNRSCIFNMPINLF